MGYAISVDAIRKWCCHVGVNLKSCGLLYEAKNILIDTRTQDFPTENWSILFELITKIRLIKTWVHRSLGFYLRFFKVAVGLRLMLLNWTRIWTQPEASVGIQSNRTLFGLNGVVLQGTWFTLSAPITRSLALTYHFLYWWLEEKSVSLAHKMRGRWQTRSYDKHKNVIFLCNANRVSSEAAVSCSTFFVL